MFGTVSPRLKGGLNRVLAAASASYYIWKGPPEVDFLISAGDAPGRATSPGVGRNLVLQAGTGPFGVWNTYRGDGGTLYLYGGPAGGSYGNGGSIVIQSAGPASSGGTAASTITITAGVGVVDGTGGAIAVTGGQSGAQVSGGGNGGPGTVQGGDSTYYNGTGGAGTVIGGHGGSTGTGGTGVVEGGSGGSYGGNAIVRPGSGSFRSGNVLLDGGRGVALATSAVAGFVMFPTCAGVPTGAPAVIPTGSVALVWDSTHRRLYSNSGSGWSSKVTAGRQFALANRINAF
jgi:hypothetical protein